MAQVPDFHVEPDLCTGCGDWRCPAWTIHEAPAESAEGAAAARSSAGRDAVVSLTPRGSGRLNDAADDVPPALAGGALMNSPG